MPTIIGAFPYNIANGQLEDAIPVMANFNWIQSQTNANAQTIATAIGTWTPTISFGGLSVGVTYAFRVGNYQRIGNMVFIAFDVLLSNKGSSVGTLQIGGLPFPINAAWATGGISACAIGLSNVTIAGKYAVAGLGGGSSLLTIADVASGGAFLTMNDTNASNSSEFFGTAFYPAA